MPNVPAESATVTTSPPIARKTNRPRDLLFLVLVMVLWASCYPLITLGLRFAPPFSFAALRALAAGVALALIAALFRRPVPRRARTWLALAGIGLGTTSLGFLGMFHAAEFVSPGLATVIANSQPLIAAVLAHVFLRERLRPLQHLGLFLGFLGVVVISLPQLGGAGRAGFLIGLAYIILAASGVASGNVVMKALSDQVDPLVAVAVQYIFGTIPLAVAALLVEQPSAITWSPSFIASLLGLALLGSAFVYWLWFTLLERIPLSHANSFTFLTPFIGFAIGVAFFGERPSLAVAIGLLLAAAGIVLVERGGYLSAATARS